MFREVSLMKLETFEPLLFQHKGIEDWFHRVYPEGGQQKLAPFLDKFAFN